MGIVANQVTFQGRLPDLSEIVEKVSEIAGLPVEVTELATEPELDLFDVNVLLAFTSAQQTQIELKVYRPGAVRESFGEKDDDFPMPQCLDGYGETEAVRTVYLRAYVGQPPFMFDATLLALESLGGCPTHAISDDARQRHEKPSSVSEMAMWVRRTKQTSVLGALLWVLMLPVMIVSGCITVLLLIPMIPWRLWKAYRAIRSGSR